MSARLRLLVFTPGDPPVACIWLQHCPHDRLEHLVDLLRARELAHSTAYATARAIQVCCNRTDDPQPRVLSVGLEAPVAVEEAHTLTFGTDVGVLVFDWVTGEALLVKHDGVEVIG